jgi:hypothetical protein
MNYLLKFPLPHTVNSGFFVRNNRISKSDKSRHFDQHVAFFQLTHYRQLAQINKALEDILAKGSQIRVDTIFVFQKSRIIGKKHQVKAIDANNRIKPALDGLVKCLIGIDDKLFFAGYYEKVICEDPKDEQVIFTFSEHKMRTHDDVLKELGYGQKETT